MKVAILVPGFAPTPRAWGEHTNLVCSLITQGYEVQVRYSHDPGIHNGRNVLLLNGQEHHVISSPWGAEYDRILWLDSDIILDPEDAETLLNADADIVSGMYPVGPAQPDAAVAGYEAADSSHFNKRLRIGALQGLADSEYPVLHEVDFVGFGCLMVRKGVFETMTFPWFDTLYETLPDGSVLNLGEDFGWCRKAKKLGHKIYVHRHVRARHEKLVIV